MSKKQTNDAAVQITWIEVVIFERVPQDRGAVGCVFIDVLQQAERCSRIVSERSPLAITIGVVDVGFSDARILLEREVLVVLCPGERGPLLGRVCVCRCDRVVAASAGRQSLAPTSSLKGLFVDRAVWKRDLGPGAARIDGKAGHCFLGRRRYSVGIAVPVLRPITALRKSRTIGLSRRRIYVI